MVERLATVIVGGGQAGLSLSYYLTQQGHEHIVLEKSAQAGEAWRNHRWDSFTLLSPNWFFNLPGAGYTGPEPDAYMPRAEIVRRFERYVADYHLPVCYSTEVNRVELLAEGSARGYIVQVGERTYQAQHVVVATGLYQKGKIPHFAGQIPNTILQIEAGEYRNPQALPPGAVLVVGSAQSGCQIAEELHEIGRKVYLSTGTAARAPRHYRGKDCFYWLHHSGFLDRTPANLPSPNARFTGNPHLSGKNGGHDLNLHRFYLDGIILLGHVQGYVDGRLFFASDLHENLGKSDKAAQDLIKYIDGYIARNDIHAVEEELAVMTEGYDAPEMSAIDLKVAGIGAIVWAAGFNFDYSMIRLPVVDNVGFPVTTRGVTQFPGLYFLGMPWIYKQRSSLLYGVGEDATYLAERILEKPGS